MSGDKSELPYKVVAIADLNDPQIDGVLLVAPSETTLATSLDTLRKSIEEYRKVNKACDSEAVLIPCPGVAGGRLIYSPTGPVNRDYDDVRRFEDAARKGAEKALAAGCRAPLVVVAGAPGMFVLATRVVDLAVLHAFYTPLEVREARPEGSLKVDRVGIWADPDDKMSLGTTTYFTSVVLTAMQIARQVCCDIGGSDPERMTPIRVAEYVTEVLAGTCIKVDVISDLAVLEKEYPLLVAVNRANKGVERQAARVIFLEYMDEQHPVDMTLIMVGKGVTYDTGGADLKVNGTMAGMHRDKCGAALVAGFFKLLSIWKPQGIKVIGAMPLVRNSVGSEAYVSDELITSRAGVRVRIGNTDAEGRMIMADVLCQMKEKALNEINPRLCTLATLTGHVIRCYGENYAAVMGNGPAVKSGFVKSLLSAGEISADPAEQSTLRREDYEAHVGKSEYEDVIQSNSKPSTMTNRGHQTPAAFLMMASGLDKHGSDSSKPLPYCHIDIAGVAGEPPAPPTGRPLSLFAHAFALNRTTSAITVPEDKQYMIGYKQ